MADSVKSIEDWENPALAMMTAFAAMQKTGLAPMIWLAPRMLEKCGEMSRELAQFVAMRIKEDMNLQNQILHCRDIAQLHRIQAEFLQTAIDQYAVETARMTGLGTQMLNDAVHPKAD